MTIITENILAGLRALAPRSQSLLIAVPADGETLDLEELVNAAHRALADGGEIIIARTLDDAFLML